MSAIIEHALVLYEAAVERFPGFTLPAPLRRCTRCNEHAAFYTDDGKFYCGPCGPAVSVFRLPISHQDIRQEAADAALEASE